MIDRLVDTGLFALGKVFWLDNIAAIAVALFGFFFFSLIFRQICPDVSALDYSLLSFRFSSVYVLCLLLLCLL
jgi:hypothetical protein